MVNEKEDVADGRLLSATWGVDELEIEKDIEARDLLKWGYRIDL